MIRDKRAIQKFSGTSQSKNYQNELSDGKNPLLANFMDSYNRNKPVSVIQLEENSIGRDSVSQDFNRSNSGSQKKAYDKGAQNSNQKIKPQNPFNNSNFFFGQKLMPITESEDNNSRFNLRQKIPQENESGIGVRKYQINSIDLRLRANDDKSQDFNNSNKNGNGQVDIWSTSRDSISVIPYSVDKNQEQNPLEIDSLIDKKYQNLFYISKMVNKLQNQNQNVQQLRKITDDKKYSFGDKKLSHQPQMTSRKINFFAENSIESSHDINHLNKSPSVYSYNKNLIDGRSNSQNISLVGQTLAENSIPGFSVYPKELVTPAYIHTPGIQSPSRIIDHSYQFHNNSIEKHKKETDQSSNIGKYIRQESFSREKQLQLNSSAHKIPTLTSFSSKKTDYIKYGSSSKDQATDLNQEKVNVLSQNFIKSGYFQAKDRERKLNTRYKSNGILSTNFAYGNGGSDSKNQKQNFMNSDIFKHNDKKYERLTFF